MTNRNVADIAIGANGSLESIANTARELLRVLKTQSSENVVQAGEPVNCFFEELTVALLNWVSSLESHKVRALLAGVQDVLFEEADDLFVLTSLSQHDQLVVKLQLVTQIMSVFLRRISIS